jgi:hypothetical protein
MEEPVTDLTAFWGEPIHTYSREEALEDGALVDVTEWARETGFRHPACFTRALWDACEAAGGDLRAWAHDVLWLGLLAVRRASAEEDRAEYPATIGRAALAVLVVLDGEGLTFGLPDDF